MSQNTEGGPPEVTLATSMGSFTVEMYTKHAPRTCRNFIELARSGYYNNVKFHRIIKDFIVQGGDPTGTGRGGQSIYDSKFDDEIDKELKHTGAGILSMANAGPNSNGSQFFITLAPAQSLDGNFFVTVTSCPVISRVCSSTTIFMYPIMCVFEATRDCICGVYRGANIPYLEESVEEWKL
ncbi:unnamed protein product [Cuscuta epithymum]|uniref:Peptidyl-prolyl cis-trans isomerase n=1 Tax=Cuscuta epithymum TaxID=186058 RepID=A0AAV0CCB6_9ASTE|nr:unnamed protein product [Cuscuta epithymum]